MVFWNLCTITVAMTMITDMNPPVFFKASINVVTYLVVVEYA